MRAGRTAGGVAPHPRETGLSQPLPFKTCRCPPPTGTAPADPYRRL